MGSDDGWRAIRPLLPACVESPRMNKVNIGLRGWRFEEAEVFGDDGRVRPIGTMPDDTKTKVLRLAERIGDPCDACWLEWGRDDPSRCRQGEAIYGEPGGEVLVCRTHEPDFIYWFREEGGADLAGDVAFGEAFHDWYVDGGRAPEGYEGIEHVDEDPDGVPTAPDPNEALPGLEEEIKRIDEEDLSGLDIDLDEFDVGEDDATGDAPDVDG